MEGKKAGKVLSIPSISATPALRDITLQAEKSESETWRYFSSRTWMRQSHGVRPDAEDDNAVLVP